MRRDCGTVINEMLKHIPPSEIQLISDLEWNKDDASYKPPEETIQWERTMLTLMKHIPKPFVEWHFEVLSIFTTKTINELKQSFP